MGEHYMRLVASLVALTVAIGTCQMAAADDGAIRIVDMAKSLAAKWKNDTMALNALSECDQNTWSVTRFSPSAITYDVRRNNSVIYPYIILISGSFFAETNDFSPKANGFISHDVLRGDRTACFKTKEQALSARGRVDFDEFNGAGYGRVEGTLIYRVSSTEYELSDVQPERLRNMLRGSILRPINRQSWSALLGGKL
jgi:hypothetical protein